MEDIFSQIKKTIKSKFNKNITLEMDINNSGIDSLDLLDLIVDLEEKLNIKISDDELISFKTFNDVANCISQKIK